MEWSEAFVPGESGAVWTLPRRAPLPHRRRQSPDLQGSHRSPAKRVRWERGGARERTDFSPAAETESNGLCADVMQEQGVSKVLTINMNDLADELKIK